MDNKTILLDVQASDDGKPYLSMANSLDIDPFVILGIKLLMNQQSLEQVQAGWSEVRGVGHEHNKWKFESPEMLSLTFDVIQKNYQQIYFRYANAKDLKDYF